MCAYVGSLTPLSDPNVQQTLSVLVLSVTTALAVPPGAPVGVSAAPVIFTAYVLLRAFLTFALAELVVVLVEAGVLALVVAGVRVSLGVVSLGVVSLGALSAVSTRLASR